MRREIKFLRGYDCINFPCRFEKKCSPENSHGKHGMEIAFLLYGDKGAVQFKFSAGWMPFYSEPDKIHVRSIPKMELEGYYPMPNDLGYHSYKPCYEGQSSLGPCNVLNGADCYYDGSSLNCNDAYYALVNGGEESLWEFLEGYYKCQFEDGEYPKPKEYTETVSSKSV